MTLIKRMLVIMLIIAMSFACNANFYIAKSEGTAIDGIFLEIENGSFEEKILNEQNNRETIAKWEFLSAVDYQKTQFVDDNAYDGQEYFRIENDSFEIRSINYIEIDGKSDYNVGVKFLSSNTENTCKISIETYDQDAKILYKIEGLDTKSKKSETWTDTSVYFSADEQVKYIKILIGITANDGWIGIDGVYGNKDFIKIYDGASIKLDKGIPGIRFFASIDQNICDEILSKYDSASIGIMIMPTKYLEEIGDYTFKSVEDKEPMLIEPTYWQNENDFEIDGRYIFNVVVILPKSEAIVGFEFCYRAYVRYTQNESEQFIYSTFNAENNSRSLQQVAIKAIEDKLNFDRYDEEQKQIVEAYIDGKIPS